jgi:hypothetical protein
MAKYKLIALANPVAGKEQEFNEWYSNVHIPDVTSLPGVKSGKRFRITRDKPWKYVAEYEIESDDIAKWEADATEALKKMVMSDSLDFNTLVTLYMEPV